MKKLLALIFILSLFLFSSCMPSEDPQGFSLEKGDYAVSIQVNTASSKGKLSIASGGDFSLMHEDPTSPLFGLKEEVKDGVYSSEFYGITSEDCPMPSGVRLLSQLLLAQESGTQGEATLETLDGVECQKVEINLAEGNGAIWICKETNRPKKMQGEANGVSITLLFSEEGTEPDETILID